jgi:hypothetical protein
MFDEAKKYTPVRLWVLSPWSIWINRYTYYLRLVFVWAALKTTGSPPMDLSGTSKEEEEWET